MQRCNIVDDDGEEFQNVDGNQLSVVVVGFVFKRSLYNFFWELNVPYEAKVNRVTSRARRQGNCLRSIRKKVIALRDDLWVFPTLFQSFRAAHLEKI